MHGLNLGLIAFISGQTLWENVTKETFGCFANLFIKNELKVGWKKYRKKHDFSIP